MEEDNKSPVERLAQALQDSSNRKKAASTSSAMRAREIKRYTVLRGQLNELPQSERRKVLDAIGLKHVSAAPEPITPLRGSSYIPQNKPTELVTLAVIESQATALRTALALAETTAQPAPAQDNNATPTPTLTATVTESVLGGVVAVKDEPLPLTTGNIAFCFAGLRWKTEEEWKKPLGDKPKWLKACISIPGVRGVSETRWNPVLIGAALVRDDPAKTNSVRAKFQTAYLLKPWLEAWKTYEADNFDMN